MSQAKNAYIKNSSSNYIKCPIKVEIIVLALPHVPPRATLLAPLLPPYYFTTLLAKPYK